MRDTSIDEFLGTLRPKIKEFLSHPRHRIWMPPKTVDANTRQFYHNLAIPSINDKPNLLLHKLGEETNPNKDILFQYGTHHRILCNTSGAGKTALVFNGLCSHWGFYFAAAQDTNMIGAQDLELAIEMMSQSPQWIRDAFKNSSSDAIQKANDVNETIAFELVYKVLLTRWTLFRAFIDVAKELNAGNLPDNIKRDWLLFQILPVVLIGDLHPFLAFMNSCLVGMSVTELQNSLAHFSPGDVLGPAFDSQSDHFFYILDEAQVAGTRYMGAFADTDGADPRPVLRPIIRAWKMVSFQSIRFIVSGTGFSSSLFKTGLTSGVGKAKGSWKVVRQTGDFINRDPQKSYITRYLPPSFLSSPSGTILVSRMYEWLRGRHRFTATFIEQLLAGAWTGKGPSSPQKLLNAYVRVFTNFTPIDCDGALLGIEPDVDSPKLAGFPWYKLKRADHCQDDGLVQELSTSLYTYITRGKYPRWYTNKQDLVEYGVARFVGQEEEVIVEEPMALVGILRYFEEEGVMIDGDIRARMQAAQGFAFEEAVLLSCTRLFQVGTCLSDVFLFHGHVPDWAYQKGQIVSRKGQELVVSDIVNGNPAIPSAGITHFARNPDDVKNWITSKSPVWCVPGTLMGPDLMAWLRLDDGKLILLLIQAKCYLAGNKDTLVPTVTGKAIRSLSPRNFYSTLRSTKAKNETVSMLEAINTVGESFTGARYNVLRVVVVYPLDGFDPARSEEIASALREDNHPFATLRHAPFLSSLATHDDTPTILSSLVAKRVRQDDGDGDEDKDEDYPTRKSRKKSAKAGV
ncbi:hypothetical protein M378DRAFT_1040593 [Amanita muscaria Koide BX008]|uniref:Uncharacterized protein n=1 Tax=Amanita muscaria (strain Koide BX008) TaxID=946122 RepID=A0A0C2TDC7_AMAMK|nr:hypothetical protein M378DRAFT_1040593 [Amanita muscaria Koide BX008]